jgi:mannose-6-phosphate isomerase|tara:strand:+ start:15872 stop:16228 length:357 start_codon:yes stop_codon:yes gene_type:complete
MNRIVKKPWGHEEIIVHTNKYVMKKLFIKAGQRLSKQFHVEKDETVYVSKGLLLLDLSYGEGETNIIKLKEGNSWRITPRTVHRFTAPEDQAVELFEVSTPELDDVVRLSDDYGRADA